jgi:hypothetical protein
MSTVCLKSMPGSATIRNYRATGRPAMGDGPKFSPLSTKRMPVSTWRFFAPVLQMASGSTHTAGPLSAGLHRPTAIVLLGLLTIFRTAKSTQAKPSALRGLMH